MTQLQPPTSQGPSWLADAVFASGDITRSAMGLLATCALAVVAWKLHQKGVPSVARQRQMGSILTTAIATASATIAVAGYLELGYLLDVFVGVVIGSVLVPLGQVVGGRVLRRVVDVERRASAAWMALGSLLWMPLAIVPPGPRSSLLFSLVFGGLAVAVGMAAISAPDIKILTGEQHR